MTFAEDFKCASMSANACANVVLFEVGKVGKNFAFRNAGRQHFEDIDHTDPHAANARASVALGGAYRYTIRQIRVHEG
jgi:hypothetical protein